MYLEVQKLKSQLYETQNLTARTIANFIHSGWPNISPWIKEKSRWSREIIWTAGNYLLLFCPPSEKTTARRQHEHRDASQQGDVVYDLGLRNKKSSRSKLKLTCCQPLLNR